MFQLILTLQIDFESISQIIKIIAYHCSKSNWTHQRQDSSNWCVFQVASCRLTASIWCLKFYKNVSESFKSFQCLMRRFRLDFFMSFSCCFVRIMHHENHLFIWQVFHSYFFFDFRIFASLFCFCRITFLLSFSFRTRFELFMIWCSLTSFVSSNLFAHIRLSIKFWLIVSIEHRM